MPGFPFAVPNWKTFSGETCPDTSNRVLPQLPLFVFPKTEQHGDIENEKII